MKLKLRIFNEAYNNKTSMMSVPVIVSMMQP